MNDEQPSQQHLHTREKGQDQYLTFLENLDYIDRSLRKSDDIEQMMQDVLDAVLSIFNADRAWLLFPCDPEASSWSVPMERTRDGYPGALIGRENVPMLTEAKEVFQAALDAGVPVPYDHPTKRRVPADAAKQFNISSQLTLALHPKLGKPWLFGMHQCTHQRIWQREEQRLFHEIGRRITDSLSLLLVLRDLRQSEDSYRRLTENARDMIYRMSLPEGRYEYVNPASFELFGYTPEEFYSTPNLIHNVIHPDWVEYLKEQWVNLLKGIIPPSYEYQIVHKSGEVRWLSQRNVLFSSAEGSPVAIEGIVTDITDRKIYEESLRKSEESLRRYEHIISSTGDLMSFVDRDYRYQAVNNAYLTAHSKRRDEIVGCRVTELVSTEVYNSLIKKNLDRAITGEIIRYQSWFTYAGIGRRYMDVRYHPFRDDSSGEIHGVVVSAHDITERKQAVDALLENERRYKQAQSLGRVGNWEFNLQTEKFWGSDEAKRIYGFDPKSKNFTTEDVEKCIPERQKVHQALLDLIEKNKPYNLEFEIHPISGPKSRTIRSIAEIVRDDAGLPIKVVGVIQDVTDRRKTEKEKRRLERQLRQSQKLESIGNLAGGIAHDFNNILTSIMGYTELTLEDVEKGSLTENNLRQVYTAGKRAQELVRQILAFARQSEEKLKPIKVNGIVVEVLKLIRSSLPASIEIQQHIATNSLINGNSTQVQQVIMNLCTNAAQAMEDDGGVLEVSLRDVVVDGGERWLSSGLSHGDYIEIVVSDTGPGVSADIIDKIFEPYFTTKEPGRGTGMGLAMTNGIVESYGGKILVESLPREKTEFAVYLPITSKSAALSDVYQTEVLPMGNERILVVDDESSVADVVAQILRRLGYSVETRTSSFEALELFRAQPNEFDLVITDMTMPNMGGDELTLELLAIRPTLPVILCTGYSNRISEESARQIGIRAFAFKPVLKADLAAAVRKVLDEVQNNTLRC